MWKTFSIDNEIFMLKTVNNDDAYAVYLSDLKDVWSREYSKENIVDKFKEANPVIVVEADEAVSQALKVLNEIDNASIEINKTDDEVDLKIKSGVIGISDTKFNVKFELNLFKEDQKEFTEKVVAPMIHTINYLEKQQKVLCDLIKKKDRELEEYKMEKGLISRTDLITEQFDPNVLKNQSEKLMLNTYGTSDRFWEGFVNKYEDVEAKVMEVKVEPWNQVKRKRKTYNAKTSAKKFASNIYKKTK